MWPKTVDDCDVAVDRGELGTVDSDDDETVFESIVYCFVLPRIGPNFLKEGF